MKAILGQGSLFEVPTAQVETPESAINLQPTEQENDTEEIAGDTFSTYGVTGDTNMCGEGEYDEYPDFPREMLPTVNNTTNQLTF